MDIPEKFRALRVQEQDGKYITQIEEMETSSLPEHDTIIKVYFSSLNYKDALSASGNKGVTKNFPHTPGIDAAGIVLKTNSDNFKVGDEVLVTGYDLGMNTPGGYGELISVPSQWATKLPAGMNMRESMIYGTAGLTAGLSIDKLIRAGVKPENGPVLVTGASGGVGSVAVAILSALGYETFASSGKKSAEDFLKKVGAKEIISRDSLLENANRPLLKEQWAGVVDTCGGEILASVLKSCKYSGSVTTCGLVSGMNLNTTVFPFILRDVNLLGIDSVELPLERKVTIWNKLAHDWSSEKLESLATYCTLEELPKYIDEILKGQIQGRVVVDLHS
ncbi:YhdH/YhfP family quinone oxidoreductase [Aureibacter tunicatorum]|uniref:Alcohol dehydrogenase n=1 Tax=Aureibacter tunicatorum TaxID=866807 RepID=A0AAE3XPE8_9BACT|nr:YhdH/YhfP family quinone oxidoreductase [Aureibacter tunicatorum]MDR6240172.1 alcohol dehydrogenase [Aureibacter tunicatorum]BDD05947.1 oxidoreductase [Aureibacter tunicatorum]